MTRIATFGSNQLYIARLLQVQQRVHTSQVQVTTEKKSPVYSGIAADVNRLVNFENQRASALSMVRNNEVTTTKLDVASTAIDSTRAAISNFKSLLDKFQQNISRDQAKIEEVQKFAYQSMVEMSAYLGATVDGQYLFSGGRITTPPVNLPADNLADFQALYDGTQNTYPTTRADHMRTINVAASDIGTATFDATYGMIKPSDFDAFDGLVKGSLFNVSGTTDNNDAFTHKGLMALNAAGTPMTETTDAGNTAFITYNNGATNILNAATGALQFEYAADGSMTVSPTIGGSLSALTVGQKFTVAGSTGDAWNGSFEVTAVNGDTISIKSDSATSTAQTTTASAVTIKRDSDANGIPDATVAWLATLGVANTDAVSFSVSGNTVTLTAATASAPGFAGSYAVGDNITIAGTDNHDGTFKVTARNQTSISFQVSPTAMRVSQFVMPQSGRSDVTMSWNQGASSLTATDYGTLAFGMTATGETITSTPAGGFLDNTGTASPPAGAVITLSGTSGVNDGQYTVKSNDGTNIVIEGRTLTAESSTTAALTQEGWYKGDTLTLQQRIDTDRVLDFGLFASDPAFEKALRAMGLIAQGAYGTAGGLENNLERVTQARFLLADAISHPAGGNAPFGTEETSDLERVGSHIASVARSVKITNDRHTWFASFMEKKIIDMENVDKTEAIARLLDDQRALEAGYQALSKVRDMSLLDFMR